MNLLSDNSTFIPSNILIEHPLCPGSTQPDSYTPTSSKMILARVNQLATPLPQIIPQSSLFFQNFLNHLIQDVGVPFVGVLFPCLPIQSAVRFCQFFLPCQFFYPATMF